MSVSNDRVVVTPNTSDKGGGVQVHHREFPEIRATGPNARDASNQLLNALTRALDSALTKARREPMEAAIAEVKQFAEASRAD